MEPTRWNFFGIIYAAIIGSAFVMLVLSIPYGTYAVFYTHLSSQGYSPQTPINYFPIYIGLLEVDIPLTSTLGALFIGLTAVYIVFVLIAVVQGGGFVRSLVASASDGAGAMLRNPMAAMIILLGATLLATVVLQNLQSAAGVGTGGLSGDTFLLFMDLTLSPLIEEIGFRFILIGVPLFVLLLLARPPWKKLAKTLWRPSAAWDEENSPRTEEQEQMQLQQPGVPIPTSTLKNFTYFLIAFSSIVFGLAHYLSGAGWGVGKISEAALDGVALGYLYVRYGLHASILFHWAVDYASNAFAFYGQGVYGIPWTANSNYSLIPTYEILFIVGLPGIVLLVNLFLKRVIRPRREAAADDSSRQVYSDPVSG